MKHFLWEWILYGNQYSVDQIMTDRINGETHIPEQYKDINFPIDKTIEPL